MATLGPCAAPWGCQATVGMRWYWYLAGVAMIGVAVGLLLFLQKPKTPPSATATEGTAAVVNAVSYGTSVAAEGGSTYKNATYHFTLKHPQELVVKEYAEKGGGHTIAFEDATGNYGFQIYITPYAESQITESRIAMDTRNGLEGIPQEVTITGMPALLFFSENQVAGRLREVWFIHEGYLYEVSTYAELDEWLAGIMSSWRFE